MATAKEIALLQGQIAKQQEQIEELTARLAQQQRLNVVLHDSNDAITIQDLQGNIILWNRGAERMYGWPARQALAMNISEIVPPDRSAEVQQVMRHIAEDHEVSSFETRRLTADCRVLDVWLTLTAIHDEQGRPVAVASTERDITARRQAEKEKNELIKELQRRNNELRQAMAETRTLRGIIPICMVCKQIRNDRGFWEQVEVYVHNHTHADFSHGICPKCMKEKFPRVFEKAKLLSGPREQKLLE